MVDNQRITLRAAARDDLGFAWSLYRESMKPLTEALLEWREEAQKHQVEGDIASGRASIIVVAGQPVGWMHWREETEEIQLLQLYVAPAMQNRGIGTAIVRELKDQAEQTNKALTLEVLKNNRAVVLYERLGFVRTDEGPYKFKMAWRAQAAA